MWLDPMELADPFPGFFEKIRILVNPTGLLRRGTASINALFFDNSLKQLVFEECK